MKTFILVITGAALLALASGCAVSPNGPFRPGAAHGALGADINTMFYSQVSGSTMAYSNSETIYDTSGSVTSTLTAADDTVRTLGYAGVNSPDGDSLFKCQLTYRVAAAFSNKDLIDDYYYTSINGGGGAFSDNGPLPGTVALGGKARPVSTDTILAGIVGRTRTLADDFTNTGSYVWQTDTIFFSTHNDTIYTWERNGLGGSYTRSRMPLIDGNNSNIWNYDLVGSTANYTMMNDDTSVSLSGLAFGHSAVVAVTCNELASYGITSATKIFGNGAGPIYEKDDFYVSLNGASRNKVEFTRQIISKTP